MSDDDYDADLEECLDWQSKYLTSGRRRDVLIEWLMDRPQDSWIVTADIIQFLQSRKVQLEQDPLSEMGKEEIYTMFKTGDVFGFGKVEGWENFSTKEKINKIANMFPKYSKNWSGLENIISEQRKQSSQE